MESIPEIFKKLMLKNTGHSMEFTDKYEKDLSTSRRCICGNVK